MLRKICGWALIVFGVLIFFAGLQAKAEASEASSLAVGIIGVLIAYGGWRLLRPQKSKNFSSQSLIKSSKPGEYSTKNCPACEKRIPVGAKSCEHCGKKQKDSDSTCSAGMNTAGDSRSEFAGERSQAKKVGSTHYIWRSARDGAVCERCANNDGRKFAWNDEPPGGHAGAKARCRCYPEPVIPRD
jgi:hypothetical protein